MTLAYGGFHQTLQEDISISLQALFRVMVFALIPYVVSTLLLERRERLVRFYSPAVYLVLVALLNAAGNPLMVMGEYGPAHVAVNVGVWIFPALFLVLCAKLSIIAAPGMIRWLGRS